MARTLNYCSHCGHEWRPRGASDISARCPSCGSRQTEMNMGDAIAPVALALGSLLVVGCFIGMNYERETGNAFLGVGQPAVQRSR